MTTFYLVRHGHADWTPDENRSLSARGWKDAESVADTLQAYPIGAVYSSPFPRARETILPLADRLGLPVRIELELQERRLTGVVAENFLTAVEATWRNPEFAHPGGETNAAAQGRGLAVVHRLRERHIAEHVVLSTHGNLMALVLQAFHPAIDFAFWRSLTMPDIYALCLNANGDATVTRLWH